MLKEEEEEEPKSKKSKKAGKKAAEEEESDDVSFPRQISSFKFRRYYFQWYFVRVYIATEPQRFYAAKQLWHSRNK